MLLLLILTLLPSSVPAVDWRYEARICGNVMVDRDSVETAMRQVRMQGCRNPTAVAVAGGDAYVVYGTKVVRSSIY